MNGSILYAINSSPEVGAGIYDLLNDQWSSMQTPNIQSEGRIYTGLGIPVSLVSPFGNDLVYVVNDATSSPAAIYHTATGTWSFGSNLPDSIPGGVQSSTVIAAGSAIMNWGGILNTQFHNRGRSYSPGLNQWSVIPAPSFDTPIGRTGHVAVWTGTEMIVWGGNDGAGLSNTGARYNPQTQTWTAMSTAGAPIARNNALAVWDGQEMIVWGGSDFRDNRADGFLYNPQRDQWTPMARGPDALQYSSAVWTGRFMLFLGHSKNQYSVCLYDPQHDSWTFSKWPDSPDYFSHGSPSVAWSGHSVIFWFGYNGVGWVYTP
jgi:N-acetylneuraminic acid mutarotase